LNFTRLYQAVAVPVPPESGVPRRLGELVTDFDWTPEFEPPPPGERVTEHEAHPWFRTSGSTREFQYLVNPPPVHQPPPLPPPEVRPPLPPLPKDRYLPEPDYADNLVALSVPTSFQYDEQYTRGNELNQNDWGLNSNLSALPDLPETEAANNNFECEAPVQFLPPPLSFRDEGDPDPGQPRPPPRQRYLSSNGSSSNSDAETPMRVARTFVHENAAAAYGRFNYNY